MRTLIGSANRPTNSAPQDSWVFSSVDWANHGDAYIDDEFPARPRRSTGAQVRTRHAQASVGVDSAVPQATHWVSNRSGGRGRSCGIAATFI